MLTVSFDLPAGWVDLPLTGGVRKGLLRRSAYEVRAHELVSSGAVIRPLRAATARYLQRVASGAPDALGIATLVQAPSREEHTFVTFAVFRGPRVDAEPLEEMASRRADDRESEHIVEPAELPWGRALKAAYTRPGLQGDGNRPFVQYWVEPTGLDTVVIALGDIDAPDGADVEKFLSDIDHLARTVTVDGMDERHR
ncbi:MAG TPA: hypothetical protein VMU75_03535 [Acidimicrobiales bacterium]|nr:hypothetical protein [Acidimicrobiales bacterium]